MNTGVFAAGVITGMAGAAAAAIAANRALAGTSAGRNVSNTAHRTAGMVSHAAQEAASAVDKIIE